MADPFGYGRIVRNHEGDVEAIVEEKDATPEQREIDEINSGILAFDAEFLVSALPRITNDNAKGEYYLTDAVGLAREDGLTVGAHLIDDVAQTEGANDRAQLAELGRELNRRIVTRWMKDGVTVMDPATTWIEADVVLEPDATILPGTQLLGATVVREDAVVGPDTTLKDCEVGAGARVVRTHGELAVIGDQATRRAVRLPPARHPARGRGQDRHVRRDQELHRSATAPRCRTCPTSATPRSARAPTSAPARSSPTTTGWPSTAPSSGATPRPAPTTPSSRRSTIGDGAGTARRHRRTPQRAGRRAGGQQRPAAQPRGLDGVEAGRHGAGRGGANGA